MASSGVKTILLRAGLVAVILVAIVFGASFFADSFIRARVERETNEKLAHYHTRIAGAHLQFLDGSLTLKQIVVVQDAHPTPPVADVPMLRMHVQWRELFSGHVVADSLLSEPHLHINLIQLRAERSNGTPIRQEGWEEALQGIYPFKINKFRIRDGDIVYIDTDSSRPLHIERLNVTADNIRNIHSPQDSYPSSLHVDAVIFETGHADIDGDANLLEEPFPGVKAKIKLRQVPLKQFEPEIKKVNFNVSGGVLNADGLMEYSPKTERAEIYNAEVDGVNIDYFHTAQTAAAEQQRVDEAKQGAKDVADKPGVILKIDALQLKNSMVAFTNYSTTPSYRLFISNFNAKIMNLSNHFSEGASDLSLSGRFMGSGNTSLKGAFQTEKAGPDFDLNLSIENTDLTSLNNLLTAYGRFDVASGTISVYSQVSVHEGWMKGYVKPMFGNLEVYSAQKDRGKPILHQAYEAVVGATAKILKNGSTQKVATEVDISGRIDDPNTSTWQALVQFLENGFIKAIVPGFDRQTRQANSGGPR
ncbi:MAG TPA: DUF748 domain-containing protein [Candidatus Binataceae bacterium]|nr:DUF748 domain-containing protein [Candidatus Binataceae bacterium]